MLGIYSYNKSVSDVHYLENEGVPSDFSLLLVSDVRTLILHKGTLFYFVKRALAVLSWYVSQFNLINYIWLNVLKVAICTLPNVRLLCVCMAYVLRYSIANLIEHSTFINGIRQQLCI